MHIAPETQPRGAKFVVGARKGFLVDYGDGLNYQVWLPSTNIVVISAYVLFDEREHFISSHALGVLALSAMELEHVLGSSVDYVSIEVLEDPKSSIDVSAITLPVETGPFPLLVVEPDADVILEREVHDARDVLWEVGMEVLRVLPLVIPPLGNLTLEEVQVELQAASNNFCPRQSKRTNKGVPPFAVHGSFSDQSHFDSFTAQFASLFFGYSSITDFCQFS